MHVLYTAIHGLYFIFKSYWFICYSDKRTLWLSWLKQAHSHNSDMLKRRGWWVAGVELRHLGSQPGDGGGLKCYHTLNRVNTVWLKQTKTLWHAYSNNSDILAPTPTLTCSLSPLICSLTGLRHIHFPTPDLLCLTLSCSLSPLWQSGFAGSKLVAVDPAWQVGVKLALQVAVDLASLVGVKLALLVAVVLASLGGRW